MDKFKYIICLSFLMIFLSSFDDYNESGKVFFNYGTPTQNISEYKSYYTNAYISTESIYSNGIYLYFYFIDKTAKKSGVMQINLASVTDNVFYLPHRDAKVYYFEKSKGKVNYKSEDISGSIVIDSSIIGSEIRDVVIKFDLQINTNGIADYLFKNGYASSTSVDEEHREENTNNNNNSTTTTTSTGCGEDPYEDTEDDDSSCSGSPSNSGVEDDNSTSSCSDEPQDETDDTSSCDGGDDSEYGDDEDTSCDSGDTSDDTSESTDSSCSSDDDEDTGDDSSGDCSGDDVEAANTFTKKKQKKNFKKMVNFFMPVFFISVFVFTLKKRKKYL